MNNVGQTNPSTWDSLRRILANPSVGAGLIQGGLQAMQPIAIGQSRLGHLANAVGEGFETGGRIAARDAEDEKQAREQQRIDQQARYQDEQVNLERERNQLTREENKSQDWARRQSNDPNRVSLDRMFGAKATFLSKAAVDETGQFDPTRMQEASDAFDAMFGNGGKTKSSTTASSSNVVTDPAIVNDTTPEAKPSSGGLGFGDSVGGALRSNVMTAPSMFVLDKMFQTPQGAKDAQAKSVVPAKPNPTQGLKVARSPQELDKLGIAIGETFLDGQGNKRVRAR
jgi:hypothetical protein